jgi:hypothetical protein
MSLLGLDQGAAEPLWRRAQQAIVDYKRYGR